MFFKSSLNEKKIAVCFFRFTQKFKSLIKIDGSKMHPLFLTAANQNIFFGRDFSESTLTRAGHRLIHSSHGAALFANETEVFYLIAL